MQKRSLRDCRLGSYWDAKCSLGMSGASISHGGFSVRVTTLALGSGGWVQEPRKGVNKGGGEGQASSGMAYLVSCCAEEVQEARRLRGGRGIAGRQAGKVGSRRASERLRERARGRILAAGAYLSCHYDIPCRLVGGSHGRRPGYQSGGIGRVSRLSARRCSLLAARLALAPSADQCRTRCGRMRLKQPPPPPR